LDKPTSAFQVDIVPFAGRGGPFTHHRGMVSTREIYHRQFDLGVVEVDLLDQFKTRCAVRAGCFKFVSFEISQVGYHYEFVSHRSCMVCSNHPCSSESTALNLTQNRIDSKYVSCSRSRR